MRAIGVVGCGFVGGAVTQGFKPVVDVEVFDLAPDKRTVNSMDELCEKVDGPIFVCVPTPMKPSGECELKIVRNVVSSIKDGKVVVIKSTVPPGTCDKLAEEFPKKDIVFNPEFLTEANWQEDFNNQKYAILGGDCDPVQMVSDLFGERFPEIVIAQTDRKTAEMVKYFTNTYLATKVAWANEIYRICTALGINYELVAKIGVANDPRIGQSHLRVPGHDGHFGFGGSCFPKDINSLIYTAKKAGVEPLVLEAAWALNLLVRPEKDWEELKGRAVIN
jgi:UDPglucose 6-dehydrogenase